MKLSTVLYVDDVPKVLEFYERAFGIQAEFVDLDVALPGRDPGGRYQFASFKVDGGNLQCATHDLGRLLMPSYARPSTGQPSGVEIAFFTPDVSAASAGPSRLALRE